MEVVDQDDGAVLSSLSLFELAKADNQEALATRYEMDQVLNARDKYGSTILHYAAGSGAWKTCHWLIQLQQKQQPQAQASSAPHPCTTTTPTTTSRSCHTKDEDLRSSQDSASQGTTTRITTTTTTTTLARTLSRNNGRSPLHWAARNGHCQICVLLVQDGHVPVDIEAKGQVTPLQLAVWQAHWETCRILVQDLHANPHYINAWGCGVAHWLAKSPLYANHQQYHLQVWNVDDNNSHEGSNLGGTSKTIVAEMEGEATTNVDDANESIKIATTTNHNKNHVGCQECHNIRSSMLEGCTWLLQECGVSSWHQANHHGQTPLHKAAYAGNVPVVEYLVQVMGQMDVLRDCQGNTAADCAERSQSQSQQHKQQKLQCTDCPPSLAQWLRRFASPLPWQALQTLRRTGTCNSTSIDSTSKQPTTLSTRTMPRLHELRRMYLDLAKVHHPDRRRPHSNSSQQCASSRQEGCGQEPQQHPPQNIYNTTGSDNAQWNSIQAAYQLLHDWWMAPNAYEVQVRCQSRMAALQEFIAILWLPEWHDEHRDAGGIHRIQIHPRITDTYNNQKGRKHVHPKSRTSTLKHSSTLGEEEKDCDDLRWTELKCFESRLIRLLSTPAHANQGLPLAQLKKEYSKTFAAEPQASTLPDPKAYQCRKWTQFLFKYCSDTIHLELDPNGIQQPRLFAKKKEVIS